MQKINLRELIVRRAVVVIVVALLISMLISEISVIEFFNGAKAKTASLIKHSYFHYLVLSKYLFEIVYFKLTLTILITVFWLLQLWKPTKPLLLRNFTSYYIILHLMYFYTLISALPIILSSVGSKDTSLVELLSILFNSIGYENILQLFGAVVIFNSLFLVFSIVHFKLAINISK